MFNVHVDGWVSPIAKFQYWDQAIKWLKDTYDGNGRVYEEKSGKQIYPEWELSTTKYTVCRKGEVSMDKHMCNGCGEMMPLDNVCIARHEENGIHSYFHIGCETRKQCSDCGFHRKVCEDCCESKEDAQ